MCVCEFVESTRNTASEAPVQSARGQACQHNCPEFSNRCRSSIANLKCTRIQELSTSRWSALVVSGGGGGGGDRTGDCVTIYTSRSHMMLGVKITAVNLSVV